MERQRGNNVDNDGHDEQMDKGAQRMNHQHRRSANAVHPEGTHSARFTHFHQRSRRTHHRTHGDGENCHGGREGGLH
ncbi:hypothetical protein SDC9_75532 [bioreactor metagenome]|uniref:Uncharacterized protein n=1 Tax=bioreactor metagenome TaxID=1076179 RepID=A0A644YSE9_9ZZZZ